MTSNRENLAFSGVKNAKKVSTLTIYSRDQCNCYFFTYPILAFCGSALIVSSSAIIAETHYFNEGKFAVFWRKAAKKVSMIIMYKGINAIDNFALDVSIPTVSVSLILETDNFKDEEFVIMACDCKESKHVHCIFKGLLQLFIFFISPILNLCKYLPTIFLS
jgi:hypothetical protein